jgi:ABC-type branched-subunit amino acid transport system substrate-binding protein
MLTAMKTIIRAIILCSLFLTPASAENIKVGVLLPLTGSFAKYGEQVKATLLQSTQGVDFIFEDEGCSGPVALSGYKKLTDNDGVKILFGPWCGTPQVVVAEQMKTRDQVAILPSSAPERVYQLSAGKMFSVQDSIEAESTFIGNQLNEAGVRKVVIVFYENDFSRAHEAAFRKAFKGAISDTIAYTSPDLPTIKSVALRIKQLKPDAVVAPDAFPLMGGLVTSLGQIGLQNLPIYSVYSAQSEDVKTALGELGRNLVYSYPDIGEEDALDHFPKKALSLLTQSTARCGESPKCIIETIPTLAEVDTQGAVKTKFILKTISGGRFVPLNRTR